MQISARGAGKGAHHDIHVQPICPQVHHALAFLSQPAPGGGSLGQYAWKVSKDAGDSFQPQEERAAGERLVVAHRWRRVGGWHPPRHIAARACCGVPFHPHLAKSELRIEGLMAVGGLSRPCGRGASDILGDAPRPNLSQSIHEERYYSQTDVHACRGAPPRPAAAHSVHTAGGFSLPCVATTHQHHARLQWHWDSVLEYIQNQNTISFATDIRTRSFVQIKEAAVVMTGGVSAPSV